MSYLYFIFFRIVFLWFITFFFPTTGTALAIAAGLAGLWLAAGWDFGAAGR
jgi:hypothetical protein